MLAVSVLLNLGLVAAVIYLIIAARRAVLREKLATYAGCIASISEGLCLPDTDRRIDAITAGLERSWAGSTSEDETTRLRWLLQAAGWIRMYRPATLADMGENLRMLALLGARSGQETAMTICEYIENPERDASGRVIEPLGKFGDDMAVGQMQVEREIVWEYGRRIRNAGVKLFEN